MPSSIQIASSGLGLIGAGPIQSFSEGGAAGETANLLYEDTYKYVLSQHFWTFASKIQRLNKLSEEPDELLNWSTLYQLPTDYIRIQYIKPISNYEIIGDKLYSNIEPLIIKYVFKIAESQLPPHFVKALHYKLASEFAPSVTEADGKAAAMEQLYRDALSDARTIDSQGHPQQEIFDQPFSDVRRSGFETGFF
jgi:hypothetical protein